LKSPHWKNKTLKEFKLIFKSFQAFFPVATGLATGAGVASANMASFLAAIRCCLRSRAAFVFAR